jgi:hypothetical protein
MKILDAALLIKFLPVPFVNRDTEINFKINS